MLIGTAAASAATIYKWVDEKGVTHYSDQPRPGAETVEVAPTQTYSAPPAPSVNTNPPAETDTSRQPAYAACEIASPANDEVLMNVSTVSGSVRLQPQLAPGHTITVELDGSRAAGPMTSGQFTISPVDRGTHSLIAVVQDAYGQTACRTPAVTFHVRQPSVKAPNRANRPRF